MAMEQYSQLIDGPVTVHVNAPPPTWTLGALKRTGICASLFMMLGMIWTASSAPSAKDLRGSSSLRIMSLAEQKTLMQYWQEAVHMTKDAADDLQAHLNDVQETADKARKQIDAWAQAKSAQNDKRISKYVKRQARAAVVLSTIDTDFKAWCFTQSALFTAQVMLLEKKFNTSDGGIVFDVDAEYHLLKRTVDKSLEVLGGMMKKITRVQTDFSILAADAKEMEREIKEEAAELDKKAYAAGYTVLGAGVSCYGGVFVAAGLDIFSLGSASLLSVGMAAGACAGVGVAGDVSIHILAEHWEHAMIDQAAYAHKLGTRATDLQSHAGADYRRMSTVKQHLDTLDVYLAPNVDIFQALVIPEMKNLVKVLQAMAHKQVILTRP